MLANAACIYPSATEIVKGVTLTGSLAIQYSWKPLVHYIAWPKLLAISDLIRLPKQYGTLLLMAPTLWALFIAAEGAPTAELIGIFVAGSFLMRSAGCVINDMADRRLDAQVERTKGRPLASGRLALSEAILVLLVLLILALLLAVRLRPLALALSPIGLGLAAGYPFAKRVLVAPQAVLGIAFGWGAVMAWAAVTGTVGLPALIILAATVFWATAYDTLYALQDVEDDTRAGVHSTARLFGRATGPAVGLLFAAALICLVSLGRMAGLGAFYHLGLLVMTLSFGFQTWSVWRPTMGQRSGNQENGLSRVAAFTLFVSNAWLGLVLLAAIILDYYARTR